MSSQSRVEEWLRQMGYMETIPLGFSKICNPSTSFLWEQIITNIKSRSEVRHKKLCIIANRLSQSGLEKQDQFSYPVREIELLKEKLTLKKKVVILEDEISEKDEIIDELLQKNRSTYAKIDTLKLRVKEKQDKNFLLQRKSKKLEKDIQNAQDLLNLAKNLTPVEMEDICDGDKVLKTLEECAEKLRKISKDLNFSKSSKSCVSSCVSRTPNQLKKSTFSNYLNQSRILHSIAPSSKKTNKSNKENIDQNICRSLKFSGNIVKSERKNRESLGLLPDDCFNISEEFDEFLLKNKSEDSGLSLNSSQTQLNVEKIICKISDKNIEEVLKGVLYENNRFLILKQFEKMSEKLLTEIKNSISDCNKLVSFPSNNIDLTELYFIHVKNELLKEKYQIKLKKLQEAIRRKKEDILLSSKSKNKDEMQKIFDLKIEENYFTGANNFLKKEINSTANIPNDNDSQIITMKITKAREQIMEKNNIIESLINAINSILEKIQTSCEETTIYVRRFDSYFRDFDWATPMTQKINQQEMEVFKSFPISYNRKLNKNSFLRDWSDTTFPSYHLFNSDFEIFVKLIEAPFSVPEKLVFEILRSKFFLSKMNKTQNLSFTDLEEKNNLDLLKSEDFVEILLRQFGKILDSKNVKDVLETPNRLEEMRHLLVEKPFINYISEKRHINGFGYKYYERQLIGLKNC